MLKERLLDIDRYCHKDRGLLDQRATEKERLIE